MDPLSITASAIAILGLTEKIIAACKAYVLTVKDAPEDLRIILINLGGLKAVIETLDFLFQSGADPSLTQGVQGLVGPDGPLEGCKKALTELRDLLPAPVFRSGAKRRRTELSLAQLAWPFKEGKARKIINQIELYKSTISLGLTTNIA